jgi:hypothetical protein
MKPIKRIHWQILILVIAGVTFLSMGQSSCPGCGDNNPTTPLNQMTPTPVPTPVPTVLQVLTPTPQPNSTPLITNGTPVVPVLPTPTPPPMLTPTPTSPPIPTPTSPPVPTPTSPPSCFAEGVSCSSDSQCCNGCCEPYSPPYYYGICNISYCM